MVCLIRGTHSFHGLFNKGNTFSSWFMFNRGTHSVHGLCLIRGTHSVHGLCFIRGTHSVHGLCLIRGTHSGRVRTTSASVYFFYSVLKKKSILEMWKSQGLETNSET